MPDLFRTKREGKWTKGETIYRIDCDTNQLSASQKESGAIPQPKENRDHISPAMNTVKFYQVSE